MAEANLRLSISPLSYATDASPTGGGSCVADSLSDQGLRHLQFLDSGGADASGGWVIVALYDSVGALRACCDLLRWPILGYISVEPDKVAR
eukprot:2326427-Amphidinium_carterae.1